MLLGCLMPLLLAAYALKQLGQVHREPAELAEILLTDLTESHPKLVPWSRRRACRRRMPVAATSL